MKVRVDPEKCQGHNRCYLACPEVYKIDDQGYAFVEIKEVPKGIEGQAKRGAEVCPEHAVVVSS